MIQLHKGDCLIESDKIESGSVDLILTDLPYGTMDTDGGRKLGIDGWDNVIDTNEVYNIANRILRKNGKMVLFCQEPFTTELVTKAIANVPFCYRMIWEKDTFANALGAKKAPVNYYEDILVFSKNYDFEGLHPLRTYFAKVIDFVGLRKKTIIEKIGQKADHVLRVKSSQFDLCTENTYLELVDVFGIDNMKGYKEYQELKQIDKKYQSTFNLWEGKKYKSNILKYKKDYDGYHPTQKPVLLLEDLIKTFSNKEDLVVDFTMGSGSTGVACANTKRSFIGIEQDNKYFAIAQERIDNAQRQSLIDFPTQ
jgi:DNA modification methylase